MRRPYLWIMVAALLGGCLLDEDFKHNGPTQPEQLADGWEIATPESVGLDPQSLAAIHQELLRPDRFVGALGFLVVKDGKLVFETYLRGLADRDHVHHLQSTTKSVTSVLFGIGRDQGWIPALDTTLCSILADKCLGLDPRKLNITLEHLLTMRSGLQFSNDWFSVEMWVDKPADPIRYILDKPLYADPGSVYNYRDADPQLVGYAMQRLSGRNEESLAREYLFAPLGIVDWYWDHGAQGESMAAHGLHLRPRDLAKFGQLMLDGGAWHGTPVVSAAWHDVSVARQVQPVGQPRLGYGYYWWTVDEAAGYSTWGHGGQYAFVIPGLRLVLVMVSMPDTDPGAIHGGELEEFVDLTRPLWQTP
jgi:Beta-lactamase class C and other penicillin binding proteins